MDPSALTVGSITSITPAQPGWAGYVGHRDDTTGQAEVHTMPVIGWGLAVNWTRAASADAPHAGDADVQPVALLIDDLGMIHTPVELGRGNDQLLAVAYGYDGGELPPAVRDWIGEQRRRAIPDRR